MCDDSVRLSKLLALQGVAFLTVIEFLISKNEFGNKSSLRNLGLVLALLIRYVVRNIPEINEDGEGDWAKKIVRLAIEHGVKIQGTYGIDDDIAELGDDMMGEDEEMDDEDEEEEDLWTWKKWNWKKEVSLQVRLRSSSKAHEYDSLPSTQNLTRRMERTSEASITISQGSVKLRRKVTLWGRDFR